MKLFDHKHLHTFKKHIIEFIKKKESLLLVGFFFVILGMFFVNTLHESYPDEFDNILGGWYSIHGIPIYKGWFTHHGPIAYWIAGIVEIFSGNSFVRFRIFYSIFLFSYIIFTFWFLRKSIGKIYSQFFLFFVFVIALSTTYFWGHMLLADSISAFFLTPVVGLLLIKKLNKLPLTISDVTFVSILSFLSILSSLTYTYVLFCIYGFTLYYFIVSSEITLKSYKKLIRPILILGIPYLVFLIYLLLTGSIMDYFFQGIVVNQKYYIYNYPRPEGVTTINPLRFAIVIFYKFLMNFSDLLIQIKDFNFRFPFNITLAVANLTLLIYLIIRRQFLLSIFFIFIIGFANARSSPLESSETDYQSAVYIMISLFVMCYMLFELYERLKENIQYREKLIYSGLFLLLAIYSFANVQFVFRKFNVKWYEKYMGNAPAIYDRPQIAPLINTIVQDDEYTWIGPFEFEELFYTRKKIASRHQIYNTAQGRSEQITRELIEDFEKNKPKLIWFDRRFIIHGESPEQYGKPFVDYIDQHYTTLYVFRNGLIRYISVKPIDQRTDIETKLYLRKENAQEIIQRLLANDIIRESQ